MKKYTIGIDPGVRMGLAVYNRETRKLAHMQTSDQETIVAVLARDYPPDTADIIIEDPSGNRPVFRETLKGAGGARAMKIAQNVGANKREAEILIARLRALDYLVVPRVPRGGRGTRGKITADKFHRVTGWQGGSSQHSRDAAMLCFGVNRLNADLEVNDRQAHN